jgi:hypothetical protein
MSRAEESEAVMFDTSSEERRSDVRNRTLYGARIAFNGGRSTINCTVRNMSLSGARLQVTSVVGIPNTFDLLIGDREPRPCRVTWRTLKELGVEFTARPS